MTTLDDDNNSRLIRWVGISLALHILIIVSLSLITSKKQSDRVFYTPSYKVDLVTLPEKKPAKRTIKKTSKTKSPAKKKALTKKKASKKKSKSSSSRAPVAAIDPSKAIERLKSKHSRDIAIEEGLARARSRIEEEEAETGDAGAARTASSKSVRKVQISDIDKELKAYYDTLWNRIKDSWVLPGQADFSGMTTVVSVTIGRGGNLIDLAIEEGSGNGFLDASTLRAIKKSAPFPPLPGGYEGGLEIGFRFTPDGQ